MIEGLEIFLELFEYGFEFLIPHVLDFLPILGHPFDQGFLHFVDIDFAIGEFSPAFIIIALHLFVLVIPLSDLQILLFLHFLVDLGQPFGAILIIKLVCLFFGHGGDVVGKSSDEIRPSLFLALLYFFLSKGLPDNLMNFFFIKLINRGSEFGHHPHDFGSELLDGFAWRRVDDSFVFRLVNHCIGLHQMIINYGFKMGG